MKFNNKIILFGGDHMMVPAVNFLLKNKINFSVFSSERHLNSKIIGENFSLEQFLNSKKINYFNIRKIDEIYLKKYKNIIANTIIGLSLSSEFIYRKKEINLFKSRLYNIHGTYLPEMRGRGGHTWSVLMGKYTFGATVHSVSEEIDGGDIILRKRFMDSS